MVIFKIWQNKEQGFQFFSKKILETGSESSKGKLVILRSQRKDIGNRPFPVFLFFQIQHECIFSIKKNGIFFTD